MKSYLTTIGGSLVPGAPRDTNTAEFTVLLVEGARADALRPQLQQKMTELGESAGEITVTMTNNEGTSNDLTVTDLEREHCRPTGRGQANPGRSSKRFRVSPTSAAISRSSGSCSG